MAQKLPLLDPDVFQQIQQKIDEDADFAHEIRDLVQELNRKTRSIQAKLSLIHSTPLPEFRKTHLPTVASKITASIATVAQLAAKASSQPYYKWNTNWSHSVQDAIYNAMLMSWILHGGALMTTSEVEEMFKVPFNLKDRDAFHFTIEEYLLAVVSLIDELARLARNSVTLGDCRLPLEISKFIKDLHAGFQILNLKNDVLRRRSDGIKYRIKEVEDVVYDLSLRNLIPKDDEGMEDASRAMSHDL